MMRKIVISIMLLHFVIKGFSQKVIPVDLIELTKITLVKNPLVKQNLLTVKDAEGSLRIQRSAFDYQLTSGISSKRNTFSLLEADPRNNFINKLKSEGTNVSIGFKKTFRSSLTANLEVDYKLATDNYPINIFNQNVGEYIDNHTVLSTFSLTQPLLRGRGKSISTALEQASKLNLESTNHTAEFRNSFELFQMSIAYWEYVTAYKSLTIYKENEARVTRVLEITQELVKADRRPASDLDQVQADLANQERQTKVAEQILYNAKLNLGRAIGLSEDDSKKLGTPLDQFPAINESGYTEELNENIFLEIAQKNRADIESAKKIQEALELRLKLSENSKKPQLDLSGFVSYGGVNNGNGLSTALATFSRNEGRDLGYGLRLNFTFPLNNNLAKGNFIRNKVALKDQEITTENLERNINLDVSIAFNNLKNNVGVLKKAKEALEFYKQVYDNEQVKFRNGMTILLNLIQFQERLTFAELDYLRAHQQFAKAIVNIRYVTGTLLVNKNGGSDVNKTLFFTIPN
ncbi:TolC family protein [Tenacibaculum aiptasiae]|uniref:TolC family protein n=1 Tax=Tenacibaculum aiptasiae TaxID=426481 RepID=UPI00232EE7AB|nr:TolC family protein [Tenacibaculum aiptasiae]